MTHTLYQHLPTPTGAARGYVGVWTNSNWSTPAPSLGFAAAFLASLPSLESKLLLFVRPRLYTAPDFGVAHAATPVVTRGFCVGGGLVSSPNGAP